MATTPQWTRLCAGLAMVFALFQWLATRLGSDRGQAGVVVGAAVVAAILAAERLLFGRGFQAAAAAVGLRRPRARGILGALGVCALLLATIVAFEAATGAAIRLSPGWLWLVPGLFAQAGIAEETLFRGYLFGHLRAGRSFWRAVSLSLIPFVAVHLLLFFTMPWPLALAAVMLAAIISLPLARLLELGGDTIWAPALVHAFVQGAVKVVVIEDRWAMRFALVWMLASALATLTVFLLPNSVLRVLVEGELP